MKNISLYLIFLLFISSSCSKDNSDNNYEDILRDSKEIIHVDEYSFVIETYSWRNFMPPSGPDNSDLITITKLFDDSNQVIPTDIILVRQYVYNGSEVWSEEYSNVSMYDEFSIQGGAWEGPTWDTGISVDVVCEFEYKDKIYWLSSKDNTIEATY